LFSLLLASGVVSVTADVVQICGFSRLIQSYNLNDNGTGVKHQHRCNWIN
jgi:hypothetical protein